jgi:asparagine synthase (glutamine-hydrolysing)
VLYRKKAGYPPTDDRRYDQLLNARLADLIADEAAPARQFMDLATAKSYLDDQAGPMGGIVNRNAKEMVLGLNEWLKLYKVRVLL